MLAERQTPGDLSQLRYEAATILQKSKQVKGEFVVRFADGKVFARHPSRLREPAEAGQ